jgi:hypothetical protein
MYPISGGETYSLYTKGVCDAVCQWLAAAGQLFSPDSGKKHF